MVSEQAAFVAVPTPLANVLRNEVRVRRSTTAGFDRAVQEATKIRNTADSVRKAGSRRRRFRWVLLRRPRLVDPAAVESP